MADRATALLPRRSANLWIAAGADASGWRGRGAAPGAAARHAISSAIGGYMAYSEEARQWKVDMRREYEQEMRLEYGDDGYAD
jgi:hypothetical protein